MSDTRPGFAEAIEAVASATDPHWRSSATARARAEMAVEAAYPVVAHAVLSRGVERLLDEAKRPVHFERPHKRGIQYAAKVLSCADFIGETENTESPSVRESPGSKAGSE